MFKDKMKNWVNEAKMPVQRPKVGDGVTRRNNVNGKMEVGKITGVTKGMINFKFPSGPDRKVTSVFVDVYQNAGTGAKGETVWARKPSAMDKTLTKDLKNVKKNMDSLVISMNNVNPLDDGMEKNIRNWKNRSAVEMVDMIANYANLNTEKMWDIMYDKGVAKHPSDGYPKYSADMTPDQVEAFKAYVIQRVPKIIKRLM